MIRVTRRYQVDPANVDEILREAAGMLPIMRDAPGFVAYYVFRLGPGDLASVGIFETQEQADESVRLAAGFVKERLAKLMPNAPEVQSGKVVAHVENPTALAKSGTLYGTRRKYRIEAANVEQIVPKLPEVARLIGGAPGCAAYYIIRHSEGLSSLGLFESQQQAEQSAQVAADWVKQNLSGLVSGPPEILSGEAVLRTVKSADAATV
ncbi:MAG: antibiotic biosynthesis monooxygenase [Chloroflexi bacterium]|nr:antibiotic biosynthesis monooxygenase [Chloroflexota bacterium]